MNAHGTFCLLVCAASIAAAHGDGVPDWNSPEIRRQAVVETAFAYYLKSRCVQYDSSPLSSFGRASRSTRRTKEGAPEDATPDSTYYTVCSSFAYETYFNAIGYRLGGGADSCMTVLLAFRPQEGVRVFEYDKDKDPERKSFEPEMRRMRELLEPGDVIVYVSRWRDNATGKRREGGHAVMYLGDIFGDGHPSVMHSAGSKYDFDSGVDRVERGGTLRIDDMDALLFLKRKLFSRAKITVLRPLALPADKWPLSESAKARLLHPRLRIDRRADCGPYGSVVSGGTIGYSVALRNFSDKAYSVAVRETAPPGTVFLPEESTGGKLGWDVPLAPGEERVVRWRVRVLAPAGSRIVSDGGTAAGIPSNSLVTEVVARRVSPAAAHLWAAANVRSAASLPDCRIEGWAGGRRAEGLPCGARITDPKASRLMEGDVVVSCANLSDPANFAVWVMGRAGLEEMTDRGLRAVGDAEVEALLAKDFFTALRPARLAESESESGALRKAVVDAALEAYRERRFFASDFEYVDEVFRRATGRGLLPSVADASTRDLVASPPPGSLLVACSRKGGSDAAGLLRSMDFMRAVLEPGDLIVCVADASDPKYGKSGARAFIYVGDPAGSGHPQVLHSVAAEDQDDSLGKLNGGVRREELDPLLGLLRKHLSSIVALRPLAALR